MPGPDQLALLIPIVAIVGGIGAGVIKSLLDHQRKMAELMAQSQSRASQSDLDGLRRDLAELKGLVHQQMIQMDNLASAQAKGPDRIEERLRVG